MALKKRDFQKIAQHIQDFLSKLTCDEDTADLRDALNLALLYMQRYYKTLRSKSYSSTASPRGCDHRSLSGALLFTNSSGAISPVSPACGVPNQFEWKWVNLESPRLSASLGTSEFSSLPPFLHAVKTGDIEVVKEVLDRDQNAVNTVDGLGRNGSMYAVHGNTEKHTECLEMMISQSNCMIDHQANDDSTALHVAAHRNNTPALNLLLQNKASCNIVDKEGRLALHWAAANPSVENLKLLLEHGACITANDCEGLTPGMWACHFEQVQNLLLLKSALARIDPREEAIFEETDLKGRSVIHWAVNKTGSIECLKELLTGSSGLLCDGEKKNVLHTASEQGVMSACQLVLDVCGNDCLSMTDNKGRTPLHLAALCGHAEVVNFLLEQGANLSIPDNKGLTAVDLIKRKHLYYCMMVLDLNPQYQSLCSLNKDVPEIIPCLDADKQPISKQRSPSAPPAREVHKDTVSQDNPSRRKSEPVPPKPLPRHNRKKSAPASQLRKECIDSAQEQNTYKDLVNDKNQNFHEGDSGNAENTGPVRRQSLLMRQGGIHEELLQEDPGTVFDMPNKLIMEGDRDDLQTQVGDLEHDDDLEIDCRNDCDDEENFVFSGDRLAEERGSPVSVQSEPDHADNCSVSVEISVSSLGSDNDEIQHFNGSGQATHQHSQSRFHKQHQQPPASGKSSFAPHPPQDQPHPLQAHGLPSQMQSHSSQMTSYSQMQSFSSQMQSHSQLQSYSSQIQPQSPHVNAHPPKLTGHSSHLHSSTMQGTFSSQGHCPNSNQSEQTKHTGYSTMDKEKKKDKKKKNKKKLSPESEPAYPIGSLRGIIAPLDPPDVHGSSKLGTTNEMMAPRPGPWEHASLGILRRGSPESPRHGQQNQYQIPDDLEADVFDGRGYRPRTPEPPPSPRNSGNKQYSSSLSGPLAHSEDLLRNTDMMKGPQSVKIDERANTSTGLLSRTKSPQHKFSLHGPMPHPPQK